MSVTQPTMPSQSDPAIVTGGLIADPVALAAKVLEWQQRGFHVLSPVMKIWAFAPGYGVNVSMVVIDSRVDDNGFGGDTYHDRATMKPEERAISALGLKRIAQCAGVAWHPDLTTRVDGRLIPNLWEYRAVGLVQAIDGTWMSLHGTKEVDLRDGSAQIGNWTPDKWAALLEANKTRPQGDREWAINGWSEKRVLQARAQGLRLAETKAMSAAIRQLGLKHKYTIAELAQPFVVLRVSYVPDLADPAVREVVMQRALAGTSALYSQVLPEPCPARYARSGTTVVDFPSNAIERLPATLPTTIPATPPAPTPPAASQPSAASPTPTPTPAAALPPTARFIAHCAVGRTGTKGGREWTRYDLELTDGSKYSTFIREIADAAARAITGKLPVTFTSEDSGYDRPKITELQIVDTRQLALPTGDDPDSSTPAPSLTARDIAF